MKLTLARAVRLSVLFVVLHLVITSLPAIAQGDSNRPGATPGVATRSIYGTDDRKEWYEINNKTVQSLARASVALFDVASLQAGSGDLVQLKARSVQETLRLCPEQKFAPQPAASFCSGTLVGPDLVLTAGHCVREVIGVGMVPPVTSVRFVFGYRMMDRTSFAAISPAQIFPGKQKVDGVYTKLENDWALVRLARPVPASIAEPVTNWDLSPVHRSQRVFVIGFPNGMPLKYAPNAYIRDTSHPDFFVANLDSFGGNSGSGVYDEITNKLIGILVRGEADYRRNESRNCNVVYQCSMEGCRGEDVTRISRVRLP